MPRLWGWKTLEISRRHTARVQTRGTRGDVTKALAELVKNADDTYGRKEEERQNSSGRILIGYWKKGHGKKQVIAGFFVRDEGMGMDIKALNRWQSYGESEPGINSAIGVGGKDALHGYDDAHVFTVRGGTPLVAEARTSTEFGDVETQAFDGKECLMMFAEFNKRLSKCENQVPPLSVERDGTTVAFRLPDERQIPIQRLDSFIHSLSHFYTLRKILARSNREMTIVDIDTGESRPVKYKQPDGVLISSKELSISHNSKVYKATLTLFRSNVDLDKETDVGENLLFVVDSATGPVLDNTMLGFELRPGARRLYGEVIIPDWRELYEIEKGTVLTDSRDGLDWNNAFNRKLKLKIYPYLVELIDKEELSKDTTAQLDEKFRRAIKEALSMINAKMKEEGEPDISGGPVANLPPDWLDFDPKDVEVTFGKERRVRLLVNPDKIPPLSKIHLEVDNSAVVVEPYPTIETPREYSDTNPSCGIMLKGHSVGGSTKLTASFRGKDATLLATVVDEKELVGESGIGMRPRNLSYSPGEKGKLKVFIDTGMFAAGTEISLSCSNSIFTISRNKIIVAEANVSDIIFENSLFVAGGEERDKTDVQAKVVGSNAEAWATVKVVRRDTPNSFFNEVKLDTSTPQGRYHFEKYDEGKFSGNGIIWIHTKSPVLSQFFGPGLTNLNDIKSDEAKVLLAETVSQCVREIWARYKLDKGIEHSLNPRDFDEIKRISDKIDAEWGPVIYRIMLGVSRERYSSKSREKPKEASKDEQILAMIAQGHTDEEVVSRFETTPYHVWQLRRKKK